MIPPLSHSKYLTTVLLVFYLAFHLLIQASATEKVLILGDSTGARFGQLLERLCIGTEVTNAAIGGTNTVDWTSHTSEVLTLCEEKSWDTVFISVGGNDYLGSGCSLGHEELSSRIEEALENIMFNIAPGASRYFMLTGCMIPFPLSISGCIGPDEFSEFLLALNMISPTVPVGSKFELFWTTDACEGGDASYSDAKYFMDDGIHLNSAGYCATFNRPDIKNFLSCPTNLRKKYSCETLDVPTNIMGYSKNCANTWVYPMSDPSEKDSSGNNEPPSSSRSLDVNIFTHQSMND